MYDVDYRYKNTITEIKISRDRLFFNVLFAHTAHTSHVHDSQEKRTIH